MFVKGLWIIIVIGVIGFFVFTNPVDPTITIKGHRWQIEVADELVEQERGLSGRLRLPPDNGMLFIYSQPAKYGFWMKDMKFALDLIWIKNNQIISINEKITPETYPAFFYAPEAVDMVLEINAGDVEKFNIKAGDYVKIKL